MGSMEFDRPEYIHMIWVFVLLWVIVYVISRSVRQSKKNILGLKASKLFFKNYSRSRQTIKTLMLFLAWCLLVIAAMGPRWGLKEETVKQRGLDMMICVDVSRSMLAEDVPPNRLERIKLDVKDMTAVLQTDRVGLIAFAGAAVSECPLTSDIAYFNETLMSLSPRSAPRGGTFIGDAVRKALKSFSKSEGRTKIIFVITDGEDQDSLPLEAAQEAANRNVKIFTVGIGDEVKGTPIPIVEDDVKRYLKHQGETVLSRMDGEMLKKMAEITEGVYVPAGTSLLNLDEIYKKYIVPLDRKGEDERQVSFLEPQFQWFVFLALVILIAEILLSTRRSVENLNE